MPGLLALDNWDPDVDDPLADEQVASEAPVIQTIEHGEAPMADETVEHVEPTIDVSVGDKYWAAEMCKLSK